MKSFRDLTHRFIASVMLALLVLALTFGLVLGSLFGGAAQVATATRNLIPAASTTPIASTLSTALATTTLPDIASVAEKVRPATVLVLNLAASNSRGRQPSASGTTIPQGAGTGFIIASDGVIVTNNHVVEGAQQVKVQLPPPDGRIFQAKVLGTDPQTDLAVLKIDATNLPTVPLGNSAALRPGDWVVAIGNALALEGGPTVTTGVVSATGRDEQEPASQINGAGPMLYGLIQTDAAINPGNSGGPLVNLQGEVVGINTLGATSAQGIGFAIAIDNAKPIIQTLSQGRPVTRAYVGIEGESITPSLAAEQGLATNDGVLIAGVVAGSPAARAGVRAGDIITGIGNVPVKALQDLQTALLNTFHPGATVDLQVNRGGATQTISVTLGQQPAN